MPGIGLEPLSMIIESQDAIKDASFLRFSRPFPQLGFVTKLKRFLLASLVPIQILLASESCAVITVANDTNVSARVIEHARAGFSTNKPKSTEHRGICFLPKCAGISCAVAAPLELAYSISWEAKLFGKLHVER